MQQNDLYNKLLKAYSDKNLNRITFNLIELQKGKKYKSIREIANTISKYVHINEVHDAKCFSKLIMLYHPDKGEYYRKTIHKTYTEKDLESLTKYSHIFLLEDIERLKNQNIAEDIDYQVEYVWDDIHDDGYSIYDSDKIEDIEIHETEEFERSFYNLIKLREYGNLDIEFPTYYLEDFETFEMANSGLESIDGVEYCKHVASLDLSGNEIVDISKLWRLENIEELFLSNNQIGLIDALSNLQKLRILDLSENQIDDISSLYYLEHLEYVNLIGNPIPDNQIKILKENKTVVLT